MARTAHTSNVSDRTHSVKGNGPAKKQQGANVPDDAGLLLRAILDDKQLRHSALGIAVLAALIGYGAVDAFIPAPLASVANDLETSYDSVYKRVRFLARAGYVQLSRVALEGQHRLLLRLVWPQTKPVTRKISSKKQG